MFVTIISRDEATQASVGQIVETAPTSLEDRPIVEDRPLMYDSKFNIYLSIIGLIGLSLIGMFWLLCRQNRKHREAMARGRAEGRDPTSIDAHFFPSVQWDPVISTTGNRSIDDKSVATTTAPPSERQTGSSEHNDDQDEAVAYGHNVEIHVTTEETYESSSISAYDESNGPMIPLQVRHSLSQGDSARRQTPLQNAVVTTTCSGPITPVRCIP